MQPVQEQNSFAASTWITKTSVDRIDWELETHLSVVNNFQHGHNFSAYTAMQLYKLISTDIAAEQEKGRGGSGEAGRGRELVSFVSLDAIACS